MCGMGIYNHEIEASTTKTEVIESHRTQLLERDHQLAIIWQDLAPSTSSSIAKMPITKLILLMRLYISTHRYDKIKLSINQALGQNLPLSRDIVHKLLDQRLNTQTRTLACIQWHQK